MVMRRRVIKGYGLGYVRFYVNSLDWMTGLILLLAVPQRGDPQGNERRLERQDARRNVVLDR